VCRFYLHLQAGGKMRGGTRYSDIRYSDSPVVQRIVRASSQSDLNNAACGMGKFRPPGTPKRISMSSYSDTTGVLKNRQKFIL